MNGAEHLNEMLEDSYVVKSDMNEDVEEAMKIIRESKRIIQGRALTTHSCSHHSGTLREMAPLFDATAVYTYWDEFGTKWHTPLIAERES